MKQPEAYRGREQTYIKHFFLERYLERVAYNILSFKDDFVYVDGFSGPWKAADEALEDTSFAIALNLLRKVRDGFKKRGRDKRIRCVFNEADPAACESLKSAVNAVKDIEILVLCGEFERAVPQIVQHVGGSFSLTFIDPTGWTGFGLQEIEPLLQHEGEAIVNFMFDYVNRFLDDPKPEIAASLDLLFGGQNWRNEIDARIKLGDSREDAILHVYRDRAKRIGGFAHVTSTRVLKPLSERAYFHLVYATRHWKGLLEFRNVERKTVAEQERVRADAKADNRAVRSGQSELFAAQGVQLGPRSFEAERQRNLEIARRRMIEMLSSQRTVKYENLLGVLLEIPLVWESDIKDWLRDMRKAGEIEMPDLIGRATTPKPGHTIVRK